MTDERMRSIPRQLTPAEQARNRELQRRQEWRHTYLVPIYFMHTSNVPPPEARAALRGVVDAVSASGQRREIVNFGSSSYGTGEYSSPDWYVAKALESSRAQGLRRDAGHEPQVLAEAIGDLFYQEPWQEHPHWEVFVVNHDLNGIERNGFLNFVFGCTDSVFPASVQSITRLIAEIPPGILREEMIRRLLRHEIGHMFGLPGKRDNHIEQKLGRHCTNVCTMRQGMSIPEWADLTREEVNKGVHFCSECMQDLARVRDRYKPLPPTR